MENVIFEVGDVEAAILFTLPASANGTTRDITPDLASVLGWNAANSAALHSALINGRKVKLEWGYRVRAYRDTAAAPTGNLLPYFRLSLSPNLNGPSDVVSVSLYTDQNFISVQRHMVLEMQFVDGLWKYFNSVSDAWGNNSSVSVEFLPLRINEATVMLPNPPNVNDSDGKFYFRFDNADVKDVTLFMSYLRVTEYL